ncbi:predicted protein [Paecilomyces variotii No. 5]|uniref:Uncharacterized protein n=1 Tax=Byssochlamys spectabilis (strain No. 5 / NBRC 109023) TaxID=1356009 RepID=V5FGR6_BYSSN|nr:predicted protein [Paecilomyces variotii No. 5]
MLDIPSQYRPSYRSHARTSSETTTTLDTKQWKRDEWISAGSGDAHCHPAPPETAGNFKKHVVGDYATAHATNPAILRHSNLPHPYNFRKQCPEALRKPFVGIGLERQEDVLPSGNWKYGNVIGDEIQRDAHLDIHVHLSREEPRQDSERSSSRTPSGSKHLVVMGHSFPDRRLTQDVFLPRFLDYRASRQPLDQVYNVDSPLNPSTVQQLDIVKTWRRLSSSQATEILHWEKAFKLILTASVEARFTSSDDVQAKTVKSTTDDKSYVSVHLDPLEIVFDMIKSEGTREAAFRWFASTGNIHRSLLRLLRNQDCFIDPLVSGPAPYPCSSIRNSSVKFKQLPKTGMCDMVGPIQVELLWNPPYISFESFDSNVEEGQAFHLRPNFCCALRGLFEDAISKGEIILTYSADVDWLHYDHNIQRFSGTVPLRRRLPGTKPPSGYIIDIVVKAELVENFGTPTLEQTMRTQVRLMVTPRKETTFEQSWRYPHHFPYQSFDGITWENIAGNETETKESIIRHPVTYQPLDVDIHNAHSPSSFPSQKDVSTVYHCRHGSPGSQADKITPTRLPDTGPDCVDPLKPAPLVVPKCRSSTLKKIQCIQHPIPSDRNRSVPRFDNHAADLEAKYSAWKFSKESKPGRRADYFIDFAATPRQRPQRQLQSSNDGEYVMPSENYGCPAFQEELSDSIRSCLSKINRIQRSHSTNQLPSIPIAPPNGEASTDLPSRGFHEHNGRGSKRPFFSSDDTTAYPSGGTTSGVDEIPEETRPTEVPAETCRQTDGLEQTQDPPLIRRDDALALLLRMRQIHEDERMSLGTNAEAIWFSSENTSEISLFESLDSWCSDHGTIFIVDDGEEADDEAEEAVNVGCV